ncbi:hypothetical protein Hamer_G021485, partial [Homarus americanus]
MTSHICIIISPMPKICSAHTTYSGHSATTITILLLLQHCQCSTSLLHHTQD